MEICFNVNDEELCVFVTPRICSVNVFLKRQLRNSKQFTGCTLDPESHQKLKQVFTVNSLVPFMKQICYTDVCFKEALSARIAGTHK